MKTIKYSKYLIPIILISAIIIIYNCSADYNYKAENYSDKLNISNFNIPSVLRNKGGFIAFRAMSNIKLHGKLCITALELPKLQNCYYLNNETKSDFESEFLIYIDRIGQFRFDEWQIKNEGIFVTEKWEAPFPRNNFNIENGKINFIGTFSFLEINDDFAIEYYTPSEFEAPDKIINFSETYKISVVNNDLSIDFNKIIGYYEYQYYPGKLFLFWD